MDSTTINLSNYTMLIQYLMEHNITVSTAESCSGGLISKLITDIPGCSAIYPGGVCSYSNEMKMKWLDVKETTLKQYVLYRRKLHRKWHKAFVWLQAVFMVSAPQA